MVASPKMAIFLFGLVKDFNSSRCHSFHFEPIDIAHVVIGPAEINVPPGEELSVLKNHLWPGVGKIFLRLEGVNCVQDELKCILRG